MRSALWLRRRRSGRPAPVASGRSLKRSCSISCMRSPHNRGLRSVLSTARPWSSGNRLSSSIRRRPSQPDRQINCGLTAPPPALVCPLSNPTSAIRSLLGSLLSASVGWWRVFLTLPEVFNMRSYLRCQFLVVGCLMLLLSISGCATLDFFSPKQVEPQGGSDRELMSLADAAIALKKYVEGRKRLQRLINQFPESELVPTARLSVGRAYFDEKRYDAARAEYQRFIELFPQHEQLDEARYYTGLSYFRQMEKVDRDQTMTKKAAREFQTLVSEFRNSQFASDAQAILVECQRRLAERELYVGKFYFNREAYGAAIPRFESVLKEYSGSEYEDQALYYLGESLWELEQKEPAKDAFHRLIAKFPDSEMTPLAATRIGMAFVQNPRSPKPSTSFLSTTLSTMSDTMSELKDAILDNSIWQPGTP